AVVTLGSGSGATGLVAFQDGTTTLGFVDLSNGRAQLSTSTLSAGVHPITATYSGDVNFAGSASGAITEIVAPVASSTSVTSNLNPAVAGQLVTFTATVTEPAGAPAGVVNF